MAMADRLLITQREAAQQLGVSQPTLIAEVAAGRLRYVLVGKRRKFKPEDLDAYAEHRRRSEIGIAAVRYTEVFGPSPPLPPTPLAININALIGRARSGAKLRGKQFDLTVQHVAEMVERAGGHCEMSGLPFSMIDVCGVKPFAPSIDRIDSSRGYNAENCRLVCYAVNVALHQWGDAVLRRIAHGIVEKADA